MNAMKEGGGRRMGWTAMATQACQFPPAPRELWNKDVQGFLSRVPHWAGIARPYAMVILTLAGLSSKTETDLECGPRCRGCKLTSILEASRRREAGSAALCLPQCMPCAAWTCFSTHMGQTLGACLLSGNSTRGKLGG